MFFSVLIPVYNVEKYLRECVESVLSQDETDYEIILVDDGSTDTSGKICDEYAQRYPNIIRVIHKENEGLLLTRRRAIREARGDWFIHLDSDDYMMPVFLAKLRTRIEETDADLVIYKIIYGTEDINDFSSTSKIPFSDNESFCGEGKHKLYMQFLSGGYITAIHQKAARRDIVDIDRDYIPFKSVSMMEDHLQSLPLLDCSQKTVFLDIPALYYRYNESSISKKKGYNSYKTTFMSIYEVYKEEGRYYQRWRLDIKDIEKVLVKHIKTMCNYIGKMAETATGKAEKKDFSQFIIWLSDSVLWKNELKIIREFKVGKVCVLCVSLVNAKQPAILRFMYQKLIPLIFRKGKNVI